MVNWQETIKKKEIRLENQKKKALYFSKHKIATPNKNNKQIPSKLNRVQIANGIICSIIDLCCLLIYKPFII